MKVNKIKGFTLIELMVVISIISLLSSVVLASLKTARDRAGEVRVVQNVKNFQIALELYKTEKGYYPVGDFSSYKYGNSIVIQKPGDFSNFSKYMNLDSAFDPNKLPENVSINYINLPPSPFEGWYGNANIIFACTTGSDSGESEYNKRLGLNRYIINISYNTNSSVFSKLLSTFAYFEGYDDFEFAGVVDNNRITPGIGYFNDRAVCVSND